MKIITILLLLIGSFAHAQNIEDALRYSFYQPYGTARFNGMGGAFTALGGDLSAVVLNPSALAVYNHDEASLSLGFLSNYTRGEIIKDGETAKGNAVVTSAGLVFKINDIQNEQNERNWSLAITYNRTADYNKSLESDLFYDESSLIDWFKEGAQGTHFTELHPFSDYLAWDTYLIDTLNGPDQYVGALTESGQQIHQKVNSSGGNSEFGIQMAHRYSNKFMFGFGLQIPIIRYNETVEHSETDFIDAGTTLNSFHYETNLSAKGIGINFKAGLIYRPIEWLRLGLAVHSPSWISIDETYSSNLIAKFDNDLSFESISPQGDFTYQLRTPAKAILGGAFVIGSHGIISIDYEWIDYTDAKFSAEDYSYNDENTEIKNMLQSANVIRLGFEWRITKWSLRAGYGKSDSPWEEESSWNNQDFSLGLAYRAEEYFVEASFYQSEFQENVSLYELEAKNSPGGEAEHVKHYLSITVGRKF